MIEEGRRAFLNTQPTVKELAEALDRLERTTIPGAPSRMLKGRLLDATDLQAKYPEYALRWVAKDKIQERRLEGYRSIGELDKEDTRSLEGVAMLMFAPRRVRDERRAANEARTAQWAGNESAQFDALAEATARELRDRHGIKSSDRMIRTTSDLARAAAAAGVR